MRTAWILLLMPVLASCVAPVNLPFESARMLKKGEVDVQGNLSAYLDDGVLVNTNYGAKVGYGLSDEHTLKLRYERLQPAYARDQSLSLFTVNYSEPVDFFEFESKLKTGRRSAAGIALAYYSFDVVSVEPRYYITFSNPRNTLECTLTPKLHVFVSQSISVFPGLSFGLGLSSDLDRWALRPEVGWDGYVSYGAALTVKLSRK